MVNLVQYFYRTTASTARRTIHAASKTIAPARSQRRPRDGFCREWSVEFSFFAFKVEPFPKLPCKIACGIFLSPLLSPRSSLPSTRLDLELLLQRDVEIVNVVEIDDRSDGVFRICPMRIRLNTISPKSLVP